MAQEKINARVRQTNLPNESDEYLSKREELRLAEIELMRQRERVAELRRGLPQGAALQEIFNKTNARCWAPDPASSGACRVG